MAPFAAGRRGHRTSAGPAPPRQVQRDKLFNLGRIQNSAGSASGQLAVARKVKITLGRPAGGRRLAPPKGAPAASVPGSREDSKGTGRPAAAGGGVVPFPAACRLPELRAPPCTAPAARRAPPPAHRFPACSAEEGTESTITNPTAAVSAALQSPRRCLGVSVSPRPLGSDRPRPPASRPRPLTQSRGA